ncbi:MAG: glycosyl hydrolase, partial [Acidobacteriaceae bacterium]
MGNALTKEDITRQLEQMHQQGIGGVEQITMDPVYERGNHPYLSPEYFDLITHAIREAKKHNMEFSLNFGGPGWIWGGTWIPKRCRNQNLLASFMDITGGQIFQGDLPTVAVLNPHDVPRSRPKILPEDRLVAVVAAQITEGRLQPSSLTDLTPHAHRRRLTWSMPPGHWRVMAFWLVDNSPQFAVDQVSVIDYLSKDAMQYYCDTLGGKFRAAFGDEFGKTVKSMFGDSFEVPNFRNGIYWNDGMVEEFKKRKGYDLVRFLPALWYDMDDLSPAIRYDVNEFLAQVGMDAFFGTFLGWCHQNG